MIVFSRSKNAAGGARSTSRGYGGWPGAARPRRCAGPRVSSRPSTGGWLSTESARGRPPGRLIGFAGGMGLVVGVVGGSGGVGASTFAAVLAAVAAADGDSVLVDVDVAG